MKIGIDCRLIKETGVGRYIEHTVSELAQLDQKNEYVLFFLDKDIHDFNYPENFKKVVANVKWHTFSEQTKLLWIFLKHNLDLLHVPQPNMPILYPKKFVVTVHDLTILRVKTGRATTLFYPLYLIKRLAFRLSLFVAVKRSAHIFTVSEYVKKDILETFDVSASKVSITYNSVSKYFVNPVADSSVLEKYGIVRPYIFYVGNAHPHKNLERLLKAFELVLAQMPDLHLVLGGKKYFFYERLEHEWKDSPCFGNLNFTGFIDDADLPSLYAFSEAFVNPSLTEGFGIQVLEAFATETKVICSNKTSLPEIAGDAGYYFDPYKVDEIAKTILDALQDPSTKKKQLGSKRLLDFSWKNSAKELLRVFDLISAAKLK